MKSRCFLLNFVLFFASFSSFAKENKNISLQIRELAKKLESMSIRSNYKMKLKKNKDEFFNFIKERQKKGFKKLTSTHLDKEEKLYINKFIHFENCYLGAALEVFNKNDKLIYSEEGPINLRNVDKIEKIRKNIYGFPLYFSGISKYLPKLYYEDTTHRDKSFRILEKLIKLCKIKSRLISSELVQKKNLLSSDLNSHDLGVYPIRESKYDSKIKAALLSDGKEALAARIASMKEAQGEGDSIFMQTLIFMADEAGLLLSGELIKKSFEGVNVEIMVDALTPFVDIRDMKVRSNTKKMYRNLMASGIPVYGYRCGMSHHLFDEFKKSVKYKRLIINERSHEKIWLVNDKWGIVGGLNVGNDYFRINKSGFDYWRDQDVLIKGKHIIQDIKNIFFSNTQSYVNNYLDPRKDFCFNKFHPLKEKERFKDFYLKNRKKYKQERIRESKKEKKLYANNRLIDIQENSSKILDSKLKFHAIEKVRVISQRPKLKELNIENAYLKLIHSAREEIILSNAYFLPSKEMIFALQNAASRGVKVHILTNSYETNDIPPIVIVSRQLYKELVDFNFKYLDADEKKGEIIIYEWTGDKNRDGILEQGMNHSKFLVVDQKKLLLGSYNIDPRSRNFNSEIAILFDGDKQNIAKDMADYFFEQDLKFANKVSYKKILSYRVPLTVRQAIALKLKGYRLDNSIYKIGVLSLFKRIADYTEDYL